MGKKDGSERGQGFRALCVQPAEDQNRRGGQQPRPQPQVSGCAHGIGQQEKDAGKQGGQQEADQQRKADRAALLDGGGFGGPVQQRHPDADRRIEQGEENGGGQRHRDHGKNHIRGQLTGQRGANGGEQRRKDGKDQLQDRFEKLVFAAQPDVEDYSNKAQKAPKPEEAAENAENIEEAEEVLEADETENKEAAADTAEKAETAADEAKTDDAAPAEEAPAGESDKPPAEEKTAE